MRTFTPSLAAGVGYGLLLVCLYLLYGFAYQGLRGQAFTIGPSHILATTAVFSLLLLFTYPINANDLYRYYIRGRISSVQGVSPFANPPDAFPDDPYLPLAGEWAGATSPYGPLWELTAGAITAIVPDNLLVGMLLFKLLGAVAHVATTILIWQLLAKQETAVRLACTLLWAWNPSLLLFFITDAHNDALMIFWLVLGWWLMQTKRISGFLVMVLGVLTKPIALLVLPYFFLAEVRKMETWSARGQYFLATVIGSLLLTLLTFLPFGSPLDLVTRLVSEASAGGGFSPTVLLILLLRSVGSTLSVSLISQTALALFGLLAVWLLWRVANGRSPLGSGALIFLGYIFQALNFRIWYVTWPFVWLILEDGTSPQRETGFQLKYGFWLLLTAQLSVIIHGHLRVYALGQDHFWGHLIGVPFTFFLPFLLAKQRSKPSLSIPQSSLSN